MHRFFSGAADFSRVNPAGLIIMAIALALSFLADPVSRKLKMHRGTVKVISLIICAGGALLAILA